MSQTIITNHYPLAPLYASIYQGLLPSKEKFLGLGGLPNRRHNETIVYHPGGTKMPSLGLVDQHLVAEWVTVPELRDAYHSYVAHLLKQAGLHQAGWHREYFHPNRFEEIQIDFAARLTPDRYIPQVRGYHRWTWDIELHTGRLWLVPRMGLRFITAEAITVPRLSAWLRHSFGGAKITAINLLTGHMATIDWVDEAWVAVKKRGTKAEPLTEGPWHITLSMEELKRIHRSKDAFLTAHEKIHAEPRDLSQTPFATILADPRPLAIPTRNVSVVTGNHLQFGRGTGSETKSVMGRGLVESPPKPIRLIIGAPEWLWEKELVKKYLRYQLYRSDDQALRRELGLPMVDTVQTIWRDKWRLPAYDFAAKAITYTKDGRLQEVEVVDQAVSEASGKDRKLVCLLLLPDELLPKKMMNTLHEQFRGRFPVVQFSISTLTGSGKNHTGYFGSWANLSAEIAVRAGGVPWDLVGLPGTTDKTLFLGIDLGHNHGERKSNLAFTLFDHRGRKLLPKHKVMNLALLDERLPDRNVLETEFQRLLRRAGAQPDQIIIHRDGRFLSDEVEELKAALSAIPAVTLVGIKKDPQTQFHPGRDGMYWHLTHDRSLLLTNTQNGSASPLEIELCVAGRNTLDDAVSQVFWLSRVYQGNVMQSPKLPVTTGQANNVAGTGNKVHVKHWARDNS